MVTIDIEDILSKFQIPKGNYQIIKEDELDESEFIFIIEEQTSKKQYLLSSTYYHPGIKEESNFYKQHGYEVKNPIQRLTGTLEVATDKDDSFYKFLYISHTLFEL